jgi:hypothetical protein
MKLVHSTVLKGGCIKEVHEIGVEKERLTDDSLAGLIFRPFVTHRECSIRQMKVTMPSCQMGLPKVGMTPSSKSGIFPPHSRGFGLVNKRRIVVPTD